MKNEQIRKFDKKLLFELGSAIIVLFLITILINGVAIYHGSSYRFQQRQKQTAENILLHLENAFEENHEDNAGSFKWFMDFWHDHYEDMDLGSYTDNDLWMQAQVICSQYDCFIPSSIDASILESFSYEDQLTLARYEYVVDNIIYNMDWSFEGMDVAGYVLRAFILEDDTAFVIFETDPDYSVRFREGTNKEEEIPEYGLGKTMSFDLNRHPNAKKVLETGQFQQEPEQGFSLRDGKLTLNYYMPIMDKGSAIGLVQLSLDWTQNAKVIWHW